MIRTRQIWTALLSLTLVAGVVAGCGGAPTKPTSNEADSASTSTPKQTTYPITIKDGAGRDVTLKAEPKRIVSVAPSNTELVFALGKGGALVGRSDYCDYPEEAKKIESVGGFAPPNYEKVLSMEPDLILMIGGSKDAREKLVNEYKQTVFVMDPKNFEGLYEGIQNLGVALNAQEQAAKVIADMKGEIEAISEKAAKATSKPKVFYEVWSDPLMTAGSGTFIDDMITAAGGVNAGADVKGWANFSLEQLAAANPEIIMTGSADRVAQIKSRSGWEGFKAIKDGKVFGAPDENLVSRPGPRLVQGLKWFAETIHPEIFTNK